MCRRSTPANIATAATARRRNCSGAANDRRPDPGSRDRSHRQQAAADSRFREEADADVDTHDASRCRRGPRGGVGRGGLAFRYRGLLPVQFHEPARGRSRLIGQASPSADASTSKWDTSPSTRQRWQKTAGDPREVIPSDCSGLVLITDNFCSVIASIGVASADAAMTPSWVARHPAIHLPSRRRSDKVATSP